MSACRLCACTDARACAGGCFWVEPDVCSACAARLPPLLIVTFARSPGVIFVGRPLAPGGKVFVRHRLPRDRKGVALACRMLAADALAARSAP